MTAQATESVEDEHEFAIGGPGGPLPIHVYDPTGEEGQPVFVFLHGGGWMLGDPDCYASLCTRLANRTGHLVCLGGLPPCARTPLPGGAPRRVPGYRVGHRPRRRYRRGSRENHRRQDLGRWKPLHRGRTARPGPRRPTDPPAGRALPGRRLSRPPRLRELPRTRDGLPTHALGIASTSPTSTFPNPSTTAIPTPSPSRRTTSPASRRRSSAARATTHCSTRPPNSSGDFGTPAFPSPTTDTRR